MRMRDPMKAKPLFKKVAWHVCSKQKLRTSFHVDEWIGKQSDGTWGEGTVYISDMETSCSGYAQILSPVQI